MVAGPRRTRDDGTEHRDVRLFGLALEIRAADPRATLSRASGHAERNAIIARTAPGRDRRR